MNACSRGIRVERRERVLYTACTSRGRTGNGERGAGAGDGQLQRAIKALSGLYWQNRALRRKKTSGMKARARPRTIPARASPLIWRDERREATKLYSYILSLRLLFSSPLLSSLLFRSPRRVHPRLSLRHSISVSIRMMRPYDALRYANADARSSRRASRSNATKLARSVDHSACSSAQILHIEHDRRSSYCCTIASNTENS